MSELKVYHHELRHNEYEEFYLKYEVEKVIENIVKGAISMFRESHYCRGLDLKSALGRIADAAFKHWNRVEVTLSHNRQLRLDKANLLRSNENLHLQLKSQITARLTDTIEYNLNIRHQKYKRCLSMKWWCASRAVVWNLDGNEKKSEWYWKWKEIWKELAEKFKEEK